MNTTQEQQRYLAALEDGANLLQKTQTNLKKCPKARLTKGYIEARLKIIDEYWMSFKNAHDGLVKITPKEQKGILPYFLNEEFFIYEELYSTLKGDLNDMVTSLTEKTPMDSQNSSMNVTYASQNIVHLPKIELPKFNGNYEGWPTFKDLFTSLVHENNNLSDVQRLHYLKTSVSGEAEALLTHIQVTSSNYATAWNVLNKRYGNRRIIMNCIMKRLFYQKKMTSQSAAQLKGLLDTTTECLNNLENLKITTGSWDHIIIFLLVQKFDPETHRGWEEFAYKEDSEVLPTWKELKTFMESKFRTLELVTGVTSSNNSKDKQIKERSYHVATPNKEKTCIMCKENHTLCHCKKFTDMKLDERTEFVKNKHLCFNCLGLGHSVKKCNLRVSCQKCHRRHHSLLHETKNTEPAATPSTSQPLASQHVVEEKEAVQVNTVIASHHTTRQGIALLATAIVKASNAEGHIISLRALIDQGSQATFISEKATQLLKLKRQPFKGCVVGVGSSRTEIKHVVQLNIRSQWDCHYSLPIQAYVMSKQLTTKIPTKTIINQTWPHIDGLNLADPSYLTPGSIDLLLGVKEYAQIIQPELIKGPPGTPTAQKTNLGWIIFGDICEKPENDTYLVMHHQVDVDEILKSIWEIEIDKDRHLTKEEKICEEIYQKTTTRNQEGRYIVKLPFKTYSPQLNEMSTSTKLQTPKGNTKEIAKQRFLQLERKFKKSPDLKKEYTKVINEYIEQGHMEKIPEKEKEIISVYLPHHAVVRTDKETSRTRIVFDASCKGTNNISLNDELLVGPQLQDDLRNLLMKWRMKRVCFMADIKQMYRQILVTREDANFQRILWRPNESDDFDEYRLLRVTFGTASAPYLAVRTLHQTADDEGKEEPRAVQSIKSNFFMDDWLDGADDTESAISLAKTVTNILRRGGFQLTKWSSNDIHFLKSIDEERRSTNARIDMNLDGTIKALGIVWNLKTDTFQYNLTLSAPASEIYVTKRSILSDLQKIFDPLGWIAPSTVMAKLLLQKLWLERVTWDQIVNDALSEEWNKIRSDLVTVNDIQLNRWLGTTEANKINIQIHGFSDASTRAYAAAVYMRTETNDKVEINLIAAKTRVAPLKTISLPKLELCGALLLSKLMKQIGLAMKIPTSDMYAWTDSSIVIAWLSGDPNRWKTFVANRVIEIIENLHNNRWYHVQSSDNPADIASRGMLLSKLKKSDLWWKGPVWLSEKEIHISKQEVMTTDMEIKTKRVNTHLSTEEQEKSITTQFENMNSLSELLMVVCYCKRFLKYKDNVNVNKQITTQELEDALTICVKRVQEEEYIEEIQRLKMNKQVKGRSPLRSLAPYLDSKHILRVGGRLRHANLPGERKHPIILGNKNTLTPLIIADAHHKTLHGGVQLMLYYLRSKYWIIKAKSMAKKYVHKCIICARLSATSRAQIMGDLPEERVTPTRPFLNSGVDFAGPFQILLSKGRGNRTTKAYVSIFICMSTKAIHIELVSDLTSEAFIGAFRRFVARRGKCNHLWSDQGRNFVGADKELRDAWKEASLQFTGKIAETLAREGTQWHFIPAYSPSFGGLWEAGVKSIKYHLKRIITNHLTYEEMTTILCQVEACLNSRPLCPMNDTHPDNTNPLTPGHFLIGEAPIVVPSPDMKDIRLSSLSRWQHTQKIVQDFWRRWQDEYLSRLQQRPKWHKKEEDFKIGDIVLIKTDNLPPGKWSLGRIVDKHPGPDGLTRVYSVKSGSSITKRTVTKLCPLPLNET
ncbi:hypothetical protein PYW08_004509 [Mythimna loreyi]|uniref:Uncharacterized protein n=1 Tax=Mythimna loreyi TaxID=667449 RepID=A0ACC2QR33_9NEOP|nr:hypothetical protein PYW08_004509 [Mythimna loreyi]